MSNTKFQASQEVIDLLAELKRVRDYKDTLKKEEDHLMQRIYNIVTEHEEIYAIDEHGVMNTLATWKYAKDSERFDTKTFKEGNPELYNEYVKISPGARTLRINK
jgi:vacuolar-type H+-ATPase subunit D/Vma8